MRFRSSERTNEKVTDDFIVAVELLSEILRQIAISRQIEALLGNAKHSTRPHPPESYCGSSVMNGQAAAYYKTFSD